jgi:hypothetical protein
MLEMMHTVTAATTTKMAVHAPCTEMAFNAMDSESIPEPAQNIMSEQSQEVTRLG